VKLNIMAGTLSAQMFRWEMMKKAYFMDVILSHSCRQEINIETI